VMYLGRIVEYGPARQVVTDPQHPYTKALLSVVPNRDPRVRNVAQILSGETPNPIAIPAGCRFRPRCPIAEASCADVDPVLGPPGSAGSGRGGSAGGGLAGHEVACLLA
jgi:oligopeptide/dipeptide ABC transporter ATP-binding protein